MRTAGKILVVALLAILAALAAVYVVLYFGFFLKANAYTPSVNCHYLFLSLLMLTSAGLSATSAVLVMKERTGKLVKAVYALTVILAIPVVFATGVWLLSFFGHQLVPPPQR